MPPKRAPIAIPSLPLQTVQQAEHCARLIWRGQSFLNSKSQTSDEKFMAQFSKPVHDFMAGRTGSIQFDPAAVHDLVVVAGLKPLFRTWNLIDMRQFETFIEVHVHSTLAGPLSAFDLGDFVKEAGRALVGPQYSGRSGYRVALASRILFFALPNVGFFNFSNDLSSALNMQSRPQVAVTPYYEQLELGLMKNIGQLNALQLPKIGPLLDPLVYQQVLVNGDWWQRRVLDLALKLYFKTVTPLNPLPPKPL